MSFDARTVNLRGDSDLSERLGGLRISDQHRAIIEAIKEREGTSHDSVALRWALEQVVAEGLVDVSGAPNDGVETEIVTDGGSEPTKHDEWSLLEVEWDCITRRAKARFMAEWETREPWYEHEARYHVYKAQDQLSVASYHARQEDTDELVKTNIADAVNHMLMAMATLDVDHDECQPITEDGAELITDGGRVECTDKLCDGVAEFAYWMPDRGHFSKVRSPERDELSDGDLSPYVCESCRDRMAAGSLYDADRFFRPEEKLVTDGGEDTDEWTPSCYDCGREMRRRHLQPTPVHIEHEDGPGYDRVEVPMCGPCRRSRLPTHECEYCDEEYLDLSDAAECCQHRAGQPLPDGGETHADELVVRDGKSHCPVDGCGWYVPAGMGYLYEEHRREAHDDPDVLPDGGQCPLDRADQLLALIADDVEGEARHRIIQVRQLLAVAQERDAR